MKINIKRLCYISIILFAVIAFNFSFADEPKRIALLPFKINAEKDMSFLRDGIYDMLTSRLAKQGQVEVISRQEAEGTQEAVAGTQAVNEAKARQIGTRLNADYVLFGSLTVFGESVSIDAKMVDVSGGKETMTFFDQSQDLGAVITKVNMIAADINANLFGRATVAKKTPAPTKTKSSQQPAQPGIYAHPEKLLEEGGYTREDSKESPFIMVGESRESTQNFWRSASFRHLINGISLGDVDGDGKIETVVITPNSVLVYRSENERFFKTAEPAKIKFQNFIGVDVADINNNGYAEIFVTSLNSGRNVLNSFVLEYDGQDYRKIVEDRPWYYRVVESPIRGKMLLGQRHRTGAVSWGNTIYELLWENSDYVARNEIKAPKETSLMGFTLGDVINNGQETAVAFRENERIQIIDSTGDVLWKGSDRYGGSMMYFVGQRTARYQVENKKYLPMRLVVWKNQAKNESEVIAVNNHDLTNMKMEYRQFTKTYMEAFAWDGLGLAPYWKTRTISGHISDYIVGDFDNDGKDELIAAVIQKEGRVALVSSPKSTIIAYELSSQGS